MQLKKASMADSTVPSTDLPIVSKTLLGQRANISQSLLDIFWSLAATNEEERIEASVNLIKALENQNEKDVEGDAESPLQYSIKRLIKGGSSSRQSAPLGFATALCEVLRHFRSQLYLTDLLTLVHEQLQTAKQDSRGHKSHCSLGKILVYSSITRSGMIKDASNSNLKTIIKALARIRSRFHTLGIATTDCLSQICTSVEADDLREVIKEHLNEELTCGWQKCTPDTLQLLMLLQDQNILDSEYLCEYCETEKLVSTKTFPHLARIMIQSTLHHPVLHPVNMMIVKRAAATSHKLFDKLWKTVIIGEVYSADKYARCHMVYQIIPEALRSYIKRPSVSSILCPELVGPLMKQMTNRDANLHKAAIKLMADIVDVVKGSSDSTLELEILRCLMTEPGSFMFDSITTSRSLANIISHLSKDAAAEFSQDLMHVMTTDTALCGRRGDMVTSWCAITLVHMLTLTSVTQNATDDAWQTDILKFILLHSCFTIKLPLPQIDHCSDVATISDADRGPIKEALLKGLSVMSTFQNTHKGVSGKTITIDYASILHSLYKYANRLVCATNEEVQPFRAISQEELAVWKDLGKTFKQISKYQKESSEDKSKTAMFSAFQLMLQLFGLHIFIIEQSERAEVIDTIQEIHACFNKAVSRTHSKKEEPEWCEVITEVLISLMSRSSHLLRSVSTSVFHKILPMCNTACIQLIMDVFQSEDDEFDADREDEGMDDEDMMSPDDSELSKNDIEKSDEDSSVSSDDSDDSDGEDEDEEVDENMRATVQAALGSAAITDTDQEDEDLSDSEMFKLDNALSEAFRSMRRKNKNCPEELERKRQIKYFKLRCLDLIDVVVKQSTKGEVLLEVIVPLLSIIEAGYKDKELKEIGKKAQTIYGHLISLRKIPTSTITDIGEVTDKVKDVLTLSTNAYVWPIMKEISGALNLMIKLLSHAEYEGATKGATKKKESLVNVVVGEVQVAVKDFLNKRESRYSHTLFQTLFERQPVLFWNSSTDLLDSISNDEIRIFYRTQACSLLAQLVNKTITAEISEQAWSEFTTSLRNVIDKVSKYLVDNYKPGFLLEFLNMIVKVKAVDRSLVLDLSSFDTISGKFNKELQKLYKRLSLANSSQADTSVRRKRKSSVTLHTDPPASGSPTKQQKKTKK